MKELILSAVLLLATKGVTTEPVEHELADEPSSKSITSVEIEPTEVVPGVAAEKQPVVTFPEVGTPDQAVEISVDAESVSEQLESDEPSSMELEVTVFSKEVTLDGLTAPSTAEPISLDELLQQTRNTPHLQREALLARLAERRRLAIALRSTLEAAEQVAAFGKPGTQLLKDSSLDTVVDAMIEKQRREKLEQNRSIQTSSQVSAIEKTPESEGPKNGDGSDPTSNFDAWQPIYIVKDARGHTVGWRHENTGERKITVVGESSEIGGASVTVVGVFTDGFGRYIVVSVDGERHEIHL